MAAASLSAQAKNAFFDDDFEQAVDLYSQAIALDPDNADLYADRAQANFKLNNFTNAIADAKKAIELDSSMVKAYLRKGIACMKLKEYETAKTALEKGASLAPGDARFTNLIKECNEHIAGEIGDLPEQKSEQAPTDNAATEFINQGLLQASIRPKFRHEFYQKPEEIVVTIFAKGIPAECVAVDFGEQILSVSISVPGEDPYYFQPRLFGKIIPAKCKYVVLSTKVEIHLAKAEAIQWTSLEFSKENAVARKVNVSSEEAQRPTYPSSKPTRTDWDKLEAQVKKEEKEEKLEGDAGLNKFFREIYSDADEDMRRAMMKSFVESNGTVLSTNWAEVGSKTVEGTPPDGMEMKKWEY